MLKPVEIRIATSIRSVLRTIDLRYKGVSRKVFCRLTNDGSPLVEIKRSAKGRLSHIQYSPLLPRAVFEEEDVDYLIDINVQVELLIEAGDQDKVVSEGHFGPKRPIRIGC